MKERISYLLSKVPFHIYLFVLVAFVFTFILSKVTLFGDDVSILKRYESNFDLSSMLSVQVHYYKAWSSRFLVNLLWFIFLKYQFLWLIFFFISVFCLFEAIYILFIKGNKYENQISIFMVSLFCSFDFRLFINAGWIATLATYLTPVAFGIVALIPIKKAFNSEKYTWYTILFFSFCLIYGGNLEQMMLVLLGVYFLSVIFLIIQKKITITFLFFSILSLANCIFCLTCPGNYNRKLAELLKFFPTFDMMTTLDKIELGFSTTLKFLIADNFNFLLIVFCFVLTICLFEKYKEIFYRVLSIIPLSIVLIFGPFKSFFSYIFHRLPNVMQDIPFYGLVNPETFGSGALSFQWFIFGAFIISVLLCIFLLVNSFKSLIIIYALLSLGILSRVCIGFSPTIYASSIRTFSVMMFCFFISLIYIVSNHVTIFGKNYMKESIITSKIFSIICYTFIVWGVLNFFVYAITYPNL